MALAAVKHGEDACEVLAAVDEAIGADCGKCRDEIDAVEAALAELEGDYTTLKGSFIEMVKALIDVTGIPDDLTELAADILLGNFSGPIPTPKVPTQEAESLLEKLVKLFKKVTFIVDVVQALVAVWNFCEDLATFLIQFEDLLGKIKDLIKCLTEK